MQAMYLFLMFKKLIVLTYDTFIFLTIKKKANEGQVLKTFPKKAQEEVTELNDKKMPTIQIKNSKILP